MKRCDQPAKVYNSIGGFRACEHHAAQIKTQAQPTILLENIRPGQWIEGTWGIGKCDYPLFPNR